MIEFVAIVLGMIVVILASCMAGERKMRADAQKSHEESERKRREEMLTAEGYRQMVKDLSDESIESAAQIDKLEAENKLYDKTILRLHQELESVKMSHNKFVDQSKRLSAELVAAQASLAKEVETNECLALKIREKDAEILHALRLRCAAVGHLNELLEKFCLLDNEREELLKEIEEMAESNEYLAGKFKESEAEILRRGELRRAAELRVQELEGLNECLAAKLREKEESLAKEVEAKKQLAMQFEEDKEEIREWLVVSGLSGAMCISCLKRTVS